MVGDDLKMRQFQIRTAEKDLVKKIGPKLKTKVTCHEIDCQTDFPFITPDTYENL